MCAINCSIYKQDRLDEDFTLIKRRGPDHFEQLKLQCNGYTVSFTSSVLHMTGSVICPQPVVSDRFIFLWNGELYAGFERSAEESDTMILFNALSCPNATVERVFDQIQGEYSFVLFDIQKSILYFGRDFFGRRSLLLRQDEDLIEIASIATVNNCFSEVNCLKEFTRLLLLLCKSLVLLKRGEKFKFLVSLIQFLLLSKNCKLHKKHSLFYYKL